MNHKQPKNNKFMQSNRWVTDIPDGETIGYLTQMGRLYRKGTKPIYYFTLDHPILERFTKYAMPIFIENMIKGDDLMGELVVLYKQDNYISIDRVNDKIEVD